MSEEVKVHQVNKSQLPLSLTPAAIKHLQQQYAKAGDAVFYFGLDEKGCSGYMYVTEWRDRADFPEHFNIADIPFHVAAKALPIVQGTTIDFVTEGLNSKMVFSNPLHQGVCGCGESFSVSDSQDR
jgi:iron-sulfur cluster assembly accessory protein